MRHLLATLLLSATSLGAHADRGAEALASTVQSPDELLSFAEAVLRAGAPTAISSLSLTSLNRVTRWPCPENTAARVVATAPADYVSVRLAVSLRVECGNRREAVLPFWFAASGHMQVPVLKRGLPAHVALSDDDAEMVARSLAELAGSRPLPSGSLANLRTTRALRHGEVLTQALVEPVPEVVASEMVELAYAVGDVRLVVAAQALEDARLGERVRLRRGDGRDSLLGRVVGSRRVELLP